MIEMDGRRNELSAGLNGDYGTGVYVKKRNIMANCALDRNATVFQTEVYARLSVARTESLVEGREETVVICSDRQARFCLPEKGEWDVKRLKGENSYRS